VPATAEFLFLFSHTVNRCWAMELCSGIVQCVVIELAILSNCAVDIVHNA
jgi:hypothetical protein